MSKYEKTFFILFFISLFSISGIAQTKSVNVDNFAFTYAYRGFPVKPLDPIRFNYAVRINAAAVVKNYVSVEEIADILKIQGQAKVDDPADASVIVELTLGNIIVSSSGVNERKVESKDKEGKVTGTTYFYSVTAKYTFESSYKITNGQKLLTGSAIYSRNSTEVYQSKEYGTRTAAADYWNNNREALIADFYRNLVISSANTVSNQASVLYGFPTYTNVRDLLKTMNEKKHDENTTFREAINSVKTELQAMTPDIPLDKEKLTDVIEYLKSLPAKYNTASKADIRMRYLAYYNLGKIYYYLDEPENVKQYADLIAPNGYDEKDGGKLNKAADELMNSFNKIGIRTQHFSPDDYFNSEQ